MSWAGEALEAIRKIVLIEERIETLTGQMKDLAHLYGDIDRRLLRLETNFELIEKMAPARPRRSPPEKADS